MRADRSRVVQRALVNVATGFVIVALAAGAGLLGWTMGRPHTKHTPPPPPPPPATALLAAVRSMQAAASYQFSGRVTIGVEVLNVSGRFSTPDRVDETLQLVGGPPIERVGVGTVTYQRGPFGWRRVAAPGANGDPRAVFTALASASGVTRNGSAYTFSVSGAAASGLVPGAGPGTVVTGSASVASGWVQSLTYRSSAGAGTAVELTCSAFGTAPQVTTPVTVPG